MNATNRQLGSVGQEAEGFHLSYCSKGLARYKVPDEVMVVDTIPGRGPGRRRTLSSGSSCHVGAIHKGPLSSDRRDGSGSQNLRLLRLASANTKGEASKGHDISGRRVTVVDVPSGSLCRNWCYVPTGCPGKRRWCDLQRSKPVSAHRTTVTQFGFNRGGQYDGKRTRIPRT